MINDEYTNLYLCNLRFLLFLFIYFLLSISHHRYCAAIQRSHASNGIWLDVDLRKGVMYQYCWDHECGPLGTPRSCAMRIPDSVLPTEGGEEVLGWEEAYIEKCIAQAIDL